MDIGWNSICTDNIVLPTDKEIDITLHRNSINPQYTYELIGRRRDDVVGSDGELDKRRRVTLIANWWETDGFECHR